MRELLLLLPLVASQVSSLPAVVLSVLTGQFINSFIKIHQYGTEEYLLLSTPICCWIMVLNWPMKELDKLQTWQKVIQGVCAPFVAAER